MFISQNNKEFHWFFVHVIVIWNKTFNSKTLLIFNGNDKNLKSVLVMYQIKRFRPLQVIKN